MKFFASTRLLIAFAASLLTGSPLVHAQYVNGQNANILWGQPNFTTGTSPTAGVGTFKNPTDFVIDPASGKFFVVDSGNNRVLRFSSASAFVTGAGAEAVFGQPDFVTVTAPAAPTAMTLNGPTGAVVDSTGTLWVADTLSNRVVGYTGAATAGGGTQPSATLVLGQLLLTSAGTAATTQSGMKGPTGVTVNSSGALYVVDKGNNRILRFNTPHVVGNGVTAINADAQIGQTNFLVGTAGTSASTLNGPTFAKIDTSGNLWVSDSLNNRILFFSSSALAGLPTTPAVATQVIGQPDFTTTTQNGQNGMVGSTGVTFDTLGRLYVADTINNRVLIYENPTTLGNGPNADFVLGHTSFLDPTANTTQAGLSAPTGILFSNLQLWVADKSNNRIINYTLSPGTPSVSSLSGFKLSTKKKSITLTYYIANTSINSDVFTASVSIPSSTSKVAKLSFSYNGEDITGALQSGTFTTPLFRSGQLPISVTIKPKSAAKKTGGTIQFTTTAASTTVPSRTATGSVNLKYKKPKQ